MSAVDTSVIVAAFASWHEAHDVARRALGHRPALLGHCAVYDALIAATAQHHRVKLLTLDARAMGTYRQLGIEAELLR